MIQVAELFADRDAVTLYAYASKHLGIALPEEFARYCLDFAERYRGLLGEGWTENEWRSWLKNRADEMGLYEPATEPESVQYSSGLLHVGFVSVEETDEHIERLRSHNPVASLPEPSRSRLAKALIAIHPVDRTAAKVAPEPR